MRFLSIIRVAEGGNQRPSERVMAEMGQLMEEMTRDGSLVLTAGLRPTSEGARVQLRKGGRLFVKDGPFTETKEVVGGFAILEAASLQDAVRLTERFLHVHGEDWDLECEVRPFDGGAECRGTD